MKAQQHVCADLLDSESMGQMTCRAVLEPLCRGVGAATLNDRTMYNISARDLAGRSS